MYKQRSRGAQGPLIPGVIYVISGFLLYTIIYTLVHDYHRPIWYYVVGVLVFLLFAWAVWRYTSVQIEYIWFGGELVLHRMDRFGRYRMILRKEDLLGLKAYGQSAGQCLRGRRRNACATLRGRFLQCCTLFCKDGNGVKWKVYFQPSRELARELAEIVQKNQQKETKQNHA